ncbi:hypothetical protein A9Q87_01920 [Flavobacteriales bacterium 34_180_T64]|nr:hypothetical protein A9Q87_01920 [Flavobacteriales bacterium 34_180_T64]
MKNLVLLFFVVFLNLNTWAQTTERIEVRGKIVVKSNDVERITVYNTSSNTGTITDEKGEFTIKVMLNDRIEFGALQFQDFKIIIDEKIMASKKMTVFLVEQVNKLNEVVILPYDLSGNLEVDVEGVKTFNADLNAIYFGVKHSSAYEFPDDQRSKAENPVMHSQGQTMVNGANIGNILGMIFKPLFKSKKSIYKESNVITETISEDEMMKKYSSQFLFDNFGIPISQTDGFIQYIENNGLDYGLLEYGKELEFLEFINQKSKIFLKLHSDKN